MQTIDLGSIIQNMDMSKKEIAKHLFPLNKYPVMALTRVIQGSAVLDANQISKLSTLSGIAINKLFSNWKMTSKNKIHTFTSEKYLATLDTESWILRLFHQESLLHEEYIIDQKFAVSDLLLLLNNQIQNYEASKV